MHPYMSFEPDFSWYHSTEGDFFGPDPQLVDAPSSAAFDEDVDNDKEVGELDLELSFKNMDEIFASFHDTIPATTPSAMTYSTVSTESLYELSSQYSESCNPTPSDYSIPSEIESRGSNDSLYSTHTSDYSASYANGPPSIDIVVQQSAASVIDPAALSLTHVAPVPDAQIAPEPVKPFRCPKCSFASARKHNLKTHIATHNKEQSKRFQCNTCGRRFSRKHDRKRHCETIHGELLSLSSTVFSISKRRVRSDPVYHPRRQNTVKREPTPTLSTYLDSFVDFSPASDVPEGFIASFQGVNL